MNILFWALALLTVVLTYVLWVRPILRERPGFKEVYDDEEAFFAALQVYFAGIKQKITTVVVFVAAVVVELYDRIVPYIQGTDFNGLTDKVPGWAWPIISVSLMMLVGYFRTLSDDRED